MGAVGEIDPAAIPCARSEDSARLIRMDAACPEDWSDEDVDIILFRATTTIKSDKIFSRLLPEFLRRSARNPHGYGWMTDGGVVRQKLEASRFQNWSDADREAVLALLPAFIATLDTDSESLAEWLEAFSLKDA